MTLQIDLAWLLMIADDKIPGDPAITDYGALIAAVSRHDASVFGRPVYRDAAERAAALLQQLLHIPALERSNAMFATAVAYGYLVASGLKVTTSPEQVRDLARLVKKGGAELPVIAAELRTWTL